MEQRREFLVSYIIIFLNVVKICDLYIGYHKIYDILYIIINHL